MAKGRMMKKRIRNHLGVSYAFTLVFVDSLLYPNKLLPALFLPA